VLLSQPSQSIVCVREREKGTRCFVVAIWEIGSFSLLFLPQSINVRWQARDTDLAVATVLCYTVLCEGDE
jgi:hypothetical protein